VQKKIHVQEKEKRLGASQYVIGAIDWYIRTHFSFNMLFFYINAQALTVMIRILWLSSALR
jgi:hypothetical protein